MKKGFIMPALSAVLLAIACDSPTEPDTRPLVRFVNAMSGMTGSGGFTANGTFAAGSALALGQSTQTCTRVKAGPSSSFSFGAANPGGTGLSANALASLSNVNLKVDGDYTLVASGSVTSPTLHLLDNSYSDSLATNQAAVRFVNYARGSGETPFSYVIFQGEIGKSPIVAMNIAVGLPTAFTKVPNGATTYSLLQMPGHIIVDTGTAFTLQAGTSNTVAVVPTAAGANKLAALPRCL